MASGPLVIVGGGVVVANAEVRSGFEPQVVGLTGVVAGGIVVLLGVRGHRQQGVVDVRRRGIPSDIRPVLVLHDDDEHRRQGRGGRRPVRERRAGRGPRGRGVLLSGAGGGGRGGRRGGGGRCRALRGGGGCARRGGGGGWRHGDGGRRRGDRRGSG